MKDTYISDSVLYIGVTDKTLDLFESQYQVPNGVTYNSYVIMDERIAVMDTVDGRATEQWFANLEQALAGESADYLIVSHMEPDHAANIKRFAERFPEAKIVGNAKTFAMIGQFFDLDLTDRKVEVKEGVPWSWEHTPCSSLWRQWFTGPRLWLPMSRRKRSCFLQTGSDVSVPWILRKTGRMRQPVTI